MFLHVLPPATPHPCRSHPGPPPPTVQWAFLVLGVVLSEAQNNPPAPALCAFAGQKPGPCLQRLQPLRLEGQSGPQRTLPPLPGLWTEVQLLGLYE